MVNRFVRFTVSRKDNFFGHFFFWSFIAAKLRSVGSLNRTFSADKYKKGKKFQVLRNCMQGHSVRVIGPGAHPIITCFDVTNWRENFRLWYNKWIQLSGNVAFEKIFLLVNWRSSLESSSVNVIRWHMVLKQRQSTVW